MAESGGSTALESSELEETKVSDVSVLAGCTVLKELYLCSTNNVF